MQQEVEGAGLALRARPVNAAFALVNFQGVVEIAFGHHLGRASIVALVLPFISVAGNKIYAKASDTHEAEFCYSGVTASLYLLAPAARARMRRIRAIRRWRLYAFGVIFFGRRCRRAGACAAGALASAIAQSADFYARWTRLIESSRRPWLGRVDCVGQC